MIFNASHFSKRVVPRDYILEHLAPGKRILSWGFFMSSYDIKKPIVCAPCELVDCRKRHRSGADLPGKLASILRVGGRDTFPSRT